MNLAVLAGAGVGVIFSESLAFVLLVAVVIYFEVSRQCPKQT